MASAALAAIEELRGLKIPALRRKYHELFGEQAKSSHNKFLFRRIAWRLQANAEGGLSDRARRRAAEIADDSDLRTRAARELISTQARRHVPRGERERSQPQGLAFTAAGHTAYTPDGQSPDRGDGARRGL